MSAGSKLGMPLLCGFEAQKLGGTRRESSAV